MRQLGSHQTRHILTMQNVQLQENSSLVKNLKSKELFCYKRHPFILEGKSSWNLPIRKAWEALVETLVRSSWQWQCKRVGEDGGAGVRFPRQFPLSAAPDPLGARGNLPNQPKRNLRFFLTAPRVGSETSQHGCGQRVIALLRAATAFDLILHSSSMTLCLLRQNPQHP